MRRRVRQGARRAGVAALLAMVLAPTLMISAAYATFSTGSTTSSSFSSIGALSSSNSTTSPLGVTQDQSKRSISATVDPSQKFVLDTQKTTTATALSQLSAPLDRAAVVSAAEVAPSTGSSTDASAGDVAAPTTNDWAADTGSAGGAAAAPSAGSSWSTNQASFYEWNKNNYQLGVAVDIGMLGQYPMGTVFELTWNGNSCYAVVNDCGYWQTNGGNYYRMFDLQSATCDALGWNHSTRWWQGVIDVQWRVVSYG